MTQTQVPTTATPAAPATLWRCGGRQCPPGECDHDEGELHRHASGAGPAYAPPIVHEVLRSPGTSLPDGARREMEGRLGHSFGDVRVHTDARAAESARAVRAHAYTVGRDIVFGAGRFRPSTPGGRELLGHELVHAAGSAPARPVPGSLRISSPDEPAETHAARTAHDAVTGQPVAGTATTPSDRLHRAVWICDEYRTLPTGTASPGPGINIAYNNQSVSVSASLAVSGAEADATNAAAIQGAVTRRWTGAFPDGYSIATTASVSTVPAGGSAPGNATDIELTRSGTHPSATNRHWLVGSQYVSLNLDGADATDYVVAHEFGHLMGLGDKYSEGIFSKLGGVLFGTQRSAVPHSGYENNIMAVHGGVLESNNVRDLISRHANTECVQGHMESPL